MANSGKVFPETKKTQNDWPMIIYDRSVHKSAQNTLYQAARANNEALAEKKWNEFVQQLKLESPSLDQIKVMINNLDDRKQWAPLHYAVDANNLYVFTQLTRHEKKFRCDINLNGGNGENVLHIAAQSHKIWKVKSSKTGENTSEGSMKTTMHLIELLVVKSDLPEIVQRMFSLGADINDRDDEYRTPLHLAVQANRYSYAKELIWRGADIMATTKLNATVLYFALLPNSANSEDLWKMVDLILSNLKQADEGEEQENHISMATLDNQTPLARALCHPEVTTDLVKKILDQIHKINEKQLLVAFDVVARYCLNRKKSFDHLSPLIDWIRSRSYQATLSELPHIICRHNNEPFLKWSYENIIKGSTSDPGQVPKYMQERDYAGYTPLLTAVFYNSKECVQSLFKQAESMKDYQYLLTANEENENILHICAKRQIDKDLFDMIWENLLDIYDLKNELMKVMDDEGNLPLEVAARFNNEHMCKKLLDHVQNIQPKDNVPFQIEGKAALAASQAGHLNILKLIVWPDFKEEQQQLPSNETKRILQTRNENRYICLHLAAAGGHKDIVDFLVTKVKIEVDAIGDRRLTPLHLACENGYEEIVRLLLQEHASVTLRNAQIYNCLEIAIINQKKKVVQELLTHSTWREMMRNAQPIEDTEAFDTPMRKLIRYMPDMAVWLIDNRFTKVVGGPGQKIYKTIYDYEFYEDIHTVKDWYTQGAKLVSEPQTCANLWHKRGIEAIHTCWCCCHSNGLGCGYCYKAKTNEKEEWYTNDAYTLVRNHPLFIASEQQNYPPIVEHFYHTHLRQTKLRSFGLVFFIMTFLFYVAYLCLFTSAVLLGKHPKYFYDKANVNLSIDLSTCEYVTKFISNNPTVTSEAVKTDTYKRIKFTLYVLLTFFIVKNMIIILALFPRVFRILTSYIEILALVLSYVYILDWFDWQSDVVFRCPVQYQLGAMGLLLAYLNFLIYVRTSPIFDIGIYVVMLQVISFKFLRFLPVLLVIICGFGFTYWMLLQYQDVYGTPIEALMRTGLMLFDLGYESRLYDANNGGQGYYKLVYVIFMLTAITCSIFVINLLIGLAVGEIPNLLTQGTLWRVHVLYSLLSDYEMLRIRMVLIFDCLSCNRFRHHQIPWFRPRPYSILEKDELVNPMGKLGVAWNYTEKHFFNEQIQDNIKPSTKSIDEKN